MESFDLLDRYSHVGCLVVTQSRLDQPLLAFGGPTFKVSDKQFGCLITAGAVVQTIEGFEHRYNFEADVQTISKLTTTAVSACGNDRLFTGVYVR